MDSWYLVEGLLGQMVGPSTAVCGLPDWVHTGVRHLAKARGVARFSPACTLPLPRLLQVPREHAPAAERRGRV